MAQKEKTPDQKRLDKLETNVAKLIQQNMILAKKVEVLTRENRRLHSKTAQQDTKIREISSRSTSRT